MVKLETIRRSAVGGDLPSFSGIADFLDLAIRITAALADFHRQGVPCGNLSPQAILLPAHKGEPLLIDPAAGHRSRPRQGAHVPLAGSIQPLAYLSPEQLRGLNQEVDCRADLYALGVIFYEQLTGQLPFSANDPLEWVHCHVAQQPTAPALMRSEVPALLSDLVMKLLSKTGDERYQTAAGLQHDLEQCLEAWKQLGTIAPFPLGSSDTADLLYIPERLYGREKEIEQLRQSFRMVAESGMPELVLVAGYSGIGKTSLVRELYRPVVRQGGYFIWGKFDQYKRNIPYATIIEAFVELIRQVLAESEEALAKWRIRLWHALGINGQLMVDIIPQLELIIGPQQAVAELPLNEAKIRFLSIFRQFVGVFADQTHPLVLFLDDLQWADNASLGLIEYLLVEQPVGSLLLIGAYRDNEVDASHPLSEKIRTLKASGCPLTTIHLKPLSFDHLRHLLADTLHSGQNQVDSLARLLYEKTRGNAFFTIQLLRTLHSERLVGVDSGGRGWQWDIEEIKTKAYADNVVDLMVGNLRKLSAQAQELLQRASCIGSSFSLAILAAVSGKSQEEIQDHLWEALLMGLIRLDHGKAVGSFLHDRVQQSAYSLMPVDRRRARHLEIGRHMLATFSPAMVEERIFDLVNQFNLGLEEITGQEERLRVAELALLAGRKALASSAFETALAYFSLGIRMADPSGWVSHFSLLYALHKEQAVALSINSRYAESQELIALLMDRAETDLQRAELSNILIIQYTLTGRYAEAITTGQEALRLLNVRIALRWVEEDFREQLERHTRLLAGRSLDSLAAEPEMTDPGCRMALELLSNMVVPARYTDNTLFALVSLHNVNLSLAHGPTPKSTVGYTSFGMFLNSALNRFTEAYAFGELALKLSDRFNAPAQKCQACFMLGHYLSPWVRPLRMADRFNAQGIEAGLASGEMQWTGYTMAYKLFQPMCRGVALGTLRAEIPELLAFTRRTKNQWATDTLLGLDLALAAMEEQEEGECPLSQVVDGGTVFLPGEEAYLDDCQAHRSYGAMGRFLVLKIRICLLYGLLEAAEQAMSRAQELLGYFSSSISVAQLNFSSSLILASRFGQADEERREEILAILERNQLQLERWQTHCPENFSSLYHLVEAERCRLLGEQFTAGRLYDQAIRQAQEQGHVHDEGLANERAGKFYVENGCMHLGALCLRRARTCYRLWGAAGKVRQMERDYPELFLADPEHAAIEPVSGIGTLDALAVIRASQAISGEIEIAELVRTLMKTVLESAGAQRGYLIGLRQGGMVIEAEAWIDGRAIGVRHAEQGSPIDATLLPVSILTYVQRSLEGVILEDATAEPRFSRDAYLIAARPLSLLCIPVLRQERLIGLLYLENNLVKGAFSPSRLKVLELLTVQAAISLENAELYQQRGRDEAALRASEEKYRTIFENSGTALLFIEDDMTISMCNKEFEVMFGYSREEVEGKLPWTELVPDAEELDRLIHFHRLRRTTPGAAPRTYESRLRAQGGKVLDVVVMATLLPGTRQSLAAVLDISERKRAETEQLRLATAIEQADEAVFITDTRFQFVYANPAFERMSGYSRQEILGQHARLLENSRHDRSFYRQIRNQLEEGRVWSGQMTCTRRDGATYEAAVTSSPVRDGAGKVINYVSIHKDVTHEMRLEEELRQAQKMEAIGTLAGGIAHDFNNILAAIMGNAELLQYSAGLKGGEQQRLEQLLSSCRRAADLVQQILTFSRKSKQERQLIRLAAVVEESMKLLRSTLPSTIEIDLRLPPADEQGVIFADPIQIHQIMMNLCTNAAHAIGAGTGRIVVEVEPVVPDDALISLHPEMSAGRYLRLTVSDNGAGMEPSVLNRVFEPYFTTKGIGKGTGLGLAVVQGIVAGNGGLITVTSEPGKGTAFLLYFPAEEAPVAVESRKAEIPRGSGRVLLVDDEPMLAQLGMDILAALGYQVTALTSSAEALEAFRRAPEAFDLVITDMTMPGLSGSDLAAEIIRLRPEMPVILCSGYSEFINERQPSDLGVRAFLQKPFTVAGLADVVQATLRSSGT